MRKLKVSDVTNSNGLPVKSGTLEHIQLAYQEAINAIARNLIGRDIDNSRAYILFGLINTGTASAMNVTAGALYYAGEVYLVDAFTLNVAQAAVASIQTSFYQTNADPVTFTDGVQRNVHEIRKIVFADAASGSGLFDFNNMVNTRLPLDNIQESTMPASLTINFTDDKAIFYQNAPNNTTISFDFTNALPGTVVRVKWAYGAGRTLAINTAGATVLRESGDLGQVANNTNVIYFLYVGRNSNGAHEVSYTLKQPL